MKITVQEINQDNELDFGEPDSSFTVSSRLVLNAENGRISYTIMDIPPYTKDYGRRRTDFAEFADSTDQTAVIAYLNGEVAGQLMLRDDWTKYALIHDLAVDPKHRRQGVGRALIRRAVDWAQAAGFPGLTLETQDINVPACRLYESCGFQLCGFDTQLYKGQNPPLDEVALFWYLTF